MLYVVWVNVNAIYLVIYLLFFLYRTVEHSMTLELNNWIDFIYVASRHITPPKVT